MRLAGGAAKEPGFIYSDAGISRHLKMELRQLAAARRQLLEADLIAYPLCVRTTGNLVILVR